jgi:hypothetical protein
VILANTILLEKEITSKTRTFADRIYFNGCSHLIIGLCSVDRIEEAINCYINMSGTYLAEKESISWAIRKSDRSIDNNLIKKFLKHAVDTELK